MSVIATEKKTIAWPVKILRPGIIPYNPALFEAEPPKKSTQSMVLHIATGCAPRTWHLASSPRPLQKKLTEAEMDTSYGSACAVGGS
jgi:hypothetical protein